MNLANHYRSVVLAAVVMSLLFCVALYANVAATAAQHRAACQARVSLYDGQFVLVRYLAHEFHATPGQTVAGLADLRRTLGPRPAC